WAFMPSESQNPRPSPSEKTRRSFRARDDHNLWGQLPKVTLLKRVKYSPLLHLDSERRGDGKDRDNTLDSRNFDDRPLYRNRGPLSTLFVYANLFAGTGLPRSGRG